MISRTSKRILIYFSLMCIGSWLGGQIVPSGKWSGKMVLPQMPLDFSLNFWQEDGRTMGTLDIPIQQLPGLAFSEIHLRADSIQLVITSSAGALRFHGAFSGDSLNGHLFQTGMKYAFRTAASGEASRPDYSPRPGATWRAEEVRFTNGNNTFAGTLTLPAGAGPHPCAILITGSGPQTRDADVSGFAIFRTLADTLSSHGFAVLRYDDRGTGSSRGTSVDHSTSEDFATDVIAAYHMLRSRKDIRPDAIGLIGHSEGGMVGPLAASKESGIAFVVMVAGPGVSGREIVLEQSRLIMKVNGSSSKAIDEQLKETAAIFDLLDHPEKLDKEKIKERRKVEKEWKKMPEEKRSSVYNPEEYKQAKAAAPFVMFDNPWFRYFQKYEPIPVIEKLRCPLLILFGEKDLQVPPAQSADTILDALEKVHHPDYTLKVIPSANHLFQTATTGSPNEYKVCPKEFIPEFWEALLPWLTSRYLK